jgi:hypothetical protein
MLFPVSPCHRPALPIVDNISRRCSLRAQFGKQNCYSAKTGFNAFFDILFNSAAVPASR